MQLRSFLPRLGDETRFGETGCDYHQHRCLRGERKEYERLVGKLLESKRLVVGEQMAFGKRGNEWGFNEHFTGQPPTWVWCRNDTDVDRAVLQALNLRHAIQLLQPERDARVRCVEAAQGRRQDRPERVVDEAEIQPSELARGSPSSHTDRLAGLRQRTAYLDQEKSAGFGQSHMVP